MITLSIKPDDLHAAASNAADVCTQRTAVMKQKKKRPCCCCGCDDVMCVSREW